jgi:hypothetical protein
MFVVSIATVPPRKSSINGEVAWAGLCESSAPNEKLANRAAARRKMVEARRNVPWQRLLARQEMADRRKAVITIQIEKRGLAGASLCVGRTHESLVVFTN